MVKLVDSALFPVGSAVDYESDEEVEALGALKAAAEAFLRTVPWGARVETLTLAFGVGPIVGLYLIGFAPTGKPEDRERWMVVGDLPSMHFETQDTLEPWLALQHYCATAQDWADNVLDGCDMSGSYPIPVAPTEEHAQMLLDRIAFIRKELMPLAG